MIAYVTVGADDIPAQNSFTARSCLHLATGLKKVPRVLALHCPSRQVRSLFCPISTSNPASMGVQPQRETGQWSHSRRAAKARSVIFTPQRLSQVALTRANRVSARLTGRIFTSATCAILRVTKSPYFPATRMNPDATTK